MLNRFDKTFWLGTATLVGSTVGVGVYALPFSFQKAGFLVGFLFLAILSVLMLLTNLFYGEIVLRTERRHQLTGYTRKYLGPVAARINLFTLMLGSYGALIGIIIINGGFLANIFSPWIRISQSTWSTFFILFAGLFILKGLKTVSKIDLFTMLVFGVVILSLGFWGVRQLDTSNFTLAIKDFWFLPFGVVVFALNGIGGVPLAREVMVGHENKLSRAIFFGTLIPASLYLLFAVLIIAICGDNTSPDAVSGLSISLGSTVAFVGSLLGFLTSSTIFLNIGVSLKESFQEDFNFKHRWSWLLVLLPPYIFYLSGVRNFIDIIGLVGGLAVSIEMIMLIFLYSKARREGDRIPEYSIRLPLPILYVMMLLFAAGAVYTVLVK